MEHLEDTKSLGPSEVDMTSTSNMPAASNPANSGNGFPDQSGEPPSKKQALSQGESSLPVAASSAPAPAPASAEESAGPVENNPRLFERNIHKPCVVLYPGDDSQVLAAHPKLDQTQLIGCELRTLVSSLNNPHIELRFSFPRGEEQSNNEAKGFGVVYGWDYNVGDIRLSKYHHISIEFSREKDSVSIEIEEATDVFKAQFPKLAEGSNVWTMVKFQLNHDDSSEVVGFGLPFMNADDSLVNDWVAENKPLHNGLSLIENLKSREIVVLVPEAQSRVRNGLDQRRLPPAQKYPYGHSFTWSEPAELEALQALIRANRGKSYSPRFVFRHITDHLMCVAQSCLQDVSWQYDDAQQIKASTVYGYMAAGVKGPRDNERYVIVHMPDKPHEVYEQAWTQLTRNLEAPFKLLLYTLWSDEKHSDQWDCKIVAHPESERGLEHFQVGNNELVLLVRLPKDNAANPDFNRVALQFDRELLGDTLRQLKATERLMPYTSATSKEALARKFEHRSKDQFESSLTGYSLQERQDIQRHLLCGTGFAKDITRPVPILARTPPEAPKQPSENDQDQEMKDTEPTSPVSDLDEGEIPDTNMAMLSIGDIVQPQRYTVTKLRCTDWISGIDRRYLQAILRQFSIEDQNRLERYLGCRPLGIGIFMAPPGFGKTFLLSLVTLLMQDKEGKIFASGPSNGAVSNFAKKMDELEGDAVVASNAGLQLADPNRRRRKLIVRAFKPLQDLKAFFNLLSFGHQIRDQPNRASGNGKWSVNSPWELELSTTQFLLAAWGSPLAGRHVGHDDPQILFDLKTWLYQQTEPKWQNLRAVILGELSMTDYIAKDLSDRVTQNDMFRQFRKIWQNADILCATPAASDSVKDFRDWKFEYAQGMAIDEAANMNKADLYGIWGNCLMPLALAGDPKQLPPAVMTTYQQDKDGNPLNRFAEEGKISAQLYLQHQGVSVYRLKTQLRMAQGMFDTVSSIMYKDLPFAYGGGQGPSNLKFRIGYWLEAFLTSKLGMTASPEGSLTPAFVHCPNARVHTDPRTGSKRSPDQVKIGLDWIVEFFKFLHEERGVINPTRQIAPHISIITPYTSNVKEIERMFKRPKYSLLGQNLPAPATIDSFQGRENDITIVIMGTRAVDPGPGFTVMPQRLNVMLTRSRCGMVVIGDINVAGHLMGPRQFSGKLNPGQYYVQKPGQRRVTRKDGMALFSFCKETHKLGRVVQRRV
ncbi:hypothetical protein NLU13_5351 [Sarocladium strictum]|uniref:DNA2/NAM7 helicase-like C-terminal domain-containing protein n=1 Tax=Sarocladium strictum TaxID=5046 RepID=A0AA39GGQ3_SARSR|nr:hypothetical protein NLU13_5351 [Sarocladium strictum]